MLYVIKETLAGFDQTNRVCLCVSKALPEWIAELELNGYDAGHIYPVGDNVGELTDMLESMSFPRSFDVLYVEISGKNFDILAQLERYRPRVIVTQYDDGKLVNLLLKRLYRFVDRVGDLSVFENTMQIKFEKPLDVRREEHVVLR
jgi:hypothetical protein